MADWSWKNSAYINSTVIWIGGMIMNRGLKIFLKTIGIILCILAVAVGGLALYITLSPQPAVWLLRNAFGGENEIKKCG